MIDDPLAIPELSARWTKLTQFFTFRMTSVRAQVQFICPSPSSYTFYKHHFISPTRCIIVQIRKNCQKKSFVDAIYINYIRMKSSNQRKNNNVSWKKCLRFWYRGRDEGYASSSRGWIVCGLTVHVELLMGDDAWNMIHVRQHNVALLLHPLCLLPRVPYMVDRPDLFSHRNTPLEIETTENQRTVTA